VRCFWPPESVIPRSPTMIDPCGENGEFHSFAYEGPMFQQPLAIEPGVTVERDGFFFADVTLSPASPFASS
jgi:diphthamide synthase (EF-2-diphthine--ammonia ligase)